MYQRNYRIVRHEDIVATLSDEEQLQLNVLLNKVDRHCAEKALECLVVEKDSPAYEATMKALQKADSNSIKSSAGHDRTVRINDIARFIMYLRMCGFGIASWYYTNEELREREKLGEIGRAFARFNNLDESEGTIIAKQIIGCAYAMPDETFNDFNLQRGGSCLQYNLAQLVDTAHMYKPIADKVIGMCDFPIRNLEYYDSEYAFFAVKRLDNIIELEDKLTKLGKISSGWKRVVLRMFGIEIPEVKTDLVSLDSYPGSEKLIVSDGICYSSPESAKRIVKLKKSTLNEIITE